MLSADALVCMFRFDEHYRVYPVSFVDKAHLEDGDKSTSLGCVCCASWDAHPVLFE